MRYRRLDLNLLVALDVLLTEKSVTRAAAKLHVTQPAMSGSLARLRDYFGDPLIVQVGRQMELTPLAEALAGSVHDIMLRIDAAIATEPEFDPASSKRHYTIGASDYVIQVLMFDLIRSIAAQAPGLTFEFRPVTAHSWQDLAAGELDMVIGPEIDVLSEHPHAPLFEDSYVVVAWKDSTVLHDDLSFDEYMGLGHVVFRSEQDGNPWLERWFLKQYGDSRRVEVIAHSFMLVAQAVIGTDRIATLQTRFAQRLARTMPLRLIESPLELPGLTEVLQWNSHRDAEPAHRWLRERIIETAQSLPAPGAAAPG
jgi:LysR family transcriptional regulator, nod-box dependent transcriptional activator